MDALRELAKQDYMNRLKYKEICDKHDLSMNTLKSWIKRHNWSDERKNLSKKGAPKNKRGAPEIKDTTKKRSKNKIEFQEEIEKLEVADLTDNQRLFCIYYVKYFNATKAYQKAYGCAYNTAQVEGSRHLTNPNIKKEIQKLKQGKFNRSMLDEDDIFQKYIDIAFSDITDYLDYGSEEVPIINRQSGEQEVDSEGNPATYTLNYVNLNDSSEVDGSLISEVSQGKDGVKVKLQDKMKALQWLSDRMDLLPKEVQARVNKINKDINTDTSAEDKLEKYFNVLGVAIDESE